MQQRLPGSVSSSATDASARLEARHLASPRNKLVCAVRVPSGPQADGDINPAVSGRRVWASTSEGLRPGVLGGELQTSLPINALV